jgi:hypothetical protein
MLPKIRLKKPTPEGHNQEIVSVKKTIHRHFFHCCELFFALLFVIQALQAQAVAGQNGSTVKMELIDEKVIAENYWYPLRAVFCKDGTILCPVILNNSQCKDLSSSVLSSLIGDGEIIRILVSRDKGKTWSVRGTYIQPFSDGKGVRVEVSAGSVGILYAFPAAMSDGSYVGMGGNIVNHLLRKDQQRLPYITTLRRFKSLDDLLAGKYEDDFPRIDIPDLAFQKGDSDHLYTGNIETGPIELDNGDWIFAMSGRFKQDNIRVPYHEFEAYQFRNWVCNSKDKGRSWNYLATIGDPEKDALPKLAEGYNETCLLKLIDDTILAAMRTGGNPNAEGTMEKYTYLAGSFSHDGGKTWEAPKPIAPYGVSPRLLQMGNGIIACSSGRPGVFMIFSRDGGTTWTEPQWVTRYHARWSQCSSGYSSIAETDLGVITILYDDNERDSQGNVLRHFVKMARYSVK